MTDNEIIKALECCARGNRCAYSCPYDDEEDKCNKCTSALTKDALDLINRQKAENDKLFYKLEGVMHSVDKWLEGDELKEEECQRACIMREKTLRLVEEKQTEIERLKEHIKHTNNVVKQVVEDTKSEAIKEFAERVKSEIPIILNAKDSATMLIMLDTLTEEMKEQKE